MGLHPRLIIVCDIREDYPGRRVRDPVYLAGVVSPPGVGGLARVPLTDVPQQHGEQDEADPHPPPSLSSGALVRHLARAVVPSLPAPGGSLGQTPALGQRGRRGHGQALSKLVLPLSSVKHQEILNQNQPLRLNFPVGVPISDWVGAALSRYKDKPGLVWLTRGFYTL